MAKATFWSRFSEEEIKDIFKNSTSYREVSMKLGYAPSGTANQTMKSLEKRFNIDTSHFTGQSHKKNKVSIDTYLKNERKINSSRLRERLLEEEYFPRQCCSCGLSEWMGKPIPLELHHKDGNRLNNMLENLDIICPNCHSFTDGYRNRKPNQEQYMGS